MSSGLILLADETYEVGTARGLAARRGCEGAAGRASTRRCGREAGAERGRSGHGWDERDGDATPLGAEGAWRGCRRREEREEPEGEKKEEGGEEVGGRNDTPRMERALDWWEGGRRVEEWLMKSQTLDAELRCLHPDPKEQRRGDGCASSRDEVEGALEGIDVREKATSGRKAARVEIGDFNGWPRNATEGKEATVSGDSDGEGIERRKDDGVRWKAEGRGGGGMPGRQRPRGKINGGLMVCFGRFAGRSISRGNGLVGIGKPSGSRLGMQGGLGRPKVDAAVPSGKSRPDKEPGKASEEAAGKAGGVEISRMGITGTMEWFGKEGSGRAGAGASEGRGQPAEALDRRMPIGIEEFDASIDGEAGTPFVESSGRSGGGGLSSPLPSSRSGNCVPSGAEEGRRSDISAKSADTRDLFGDAFVCGETGRAELPNGFHSANSNRPRKSGFPSENSEINRSKNLIKINEKKENHRVNKVCDAVNVQRRMARKKFDLKSKIAAEILRRRKNTLLALEKIKGIRLEGGNDAKDTASSKADGGDGGATLDAGRVTLETLSSRISELTGSGGHGYMCGHAEGRRRILEILRLQEEFLAHYRVRDDYFCRQKEWKAVKRVLEATVAEDALKEEEGSGDAKETKESKDASSSNEAVHLQQRLRSLSTELVTLRNRLHVSQPNGGGANAPAQSHHQGANTAHHPHGAPQHQPHLGGHHGGVAALGNPHLSPDDPKSRLHLSGGGVRSGAGCGPLMGRPAPAMAPATPPGAHPSHLHQGQHGAAPSPGSAPRCAVPSASTADIDDLIHLPGPLTEDAVIRCLHSRFCASQFYTNVGPILVCVNNRRDDGNPLTLSSTRSIPLDPKLSRVVTDAVRQQSETGYPQAIILSGSSGSGKTYTSMLVLRQLFEVAGGGPETDAFKHLAAAFTVLRSLGSARTASNPESSRIGHFIEVQVTDGSLYRTKIHCYFLDQTRVVRPLDSSEKNYHIFYQMLAGLTDQEREKLGLQDYGIHNLRYLNRGNTSQDESRDAARFLAWKACLGILGIPFLEVVRVLSAVLLLGNIQFVEGSRSRAIEVIEVCGSTSSSSGTNGASSGWKKRRRRKRRRGKRASRKHPAASEEEGDLEEDEVDEEGEEEGEEAEEGEEEDGKRRRSAPRTRGGEEDGEGEDGEEEEGEEEGEEEDGGGRRRNGRRNGGAGSGDELLASVASLLGVAPDALMQGLTTRTRNVRGQLVRTSSDADICNATRDSLAKALYCRTVATIVRRANSLKRPLGSTSGTLSSDSNDSVHNQAAEVSSQHASTIGTAGSKSSKSMVALNNAVRHATHGFIGILDMFGFEDPKPSQLEHLCINLCAETMQHFYNTHVFKSSIESCRDEGIQCSVQAEYVDNVPCIDLISSLRTGLLSMLDVECSVRGTPESYVQKVRVQHRHNPRLVSEVNMGSSGGRTTQHHVNGYQYGQQSQMARQGHLASLMNSSAATSFAIRHFAGTVVYDSANFLETNRDVVPDDLVSVFHRHHCNFGFATHLFGSELKALSTSSTHIIAPGMTPPVPSSHQQGGAILPRGVAFRISPTSHTDLQNGDEPVSTLTQDFHTRLDNLLRTLVHARPHFVRCIRADEEGSTYATNGTQGGGIPEEFARQAVRRQIRSLQILETVNLMAGGFPHRMRFKAFNNRYRSLAPSHCLRSNGQRPCVAPNGGDGGNGGQQEGAEMCVLILQCFQQALLIAGSGAGQQAQQHITRNQSQQLGKGLSLGMIAAGSGLLPTSNVSTAWATGKRHIFLSEGARQQLEAMRWERLRRAAVTIQSTWRGWHFRRRRWPTLRLSLGDVRQRVPSQPGGSSQPPSQPPPPPPPPPQHAQIGGGLSCPSPGKPTAGAGRAGAVGGGAGKLSGNGSSAAAGVGANQGGSLSRPRPQPISGTPPPLEEGGTGGNGAGAAGGNGAGGGALATGVEKCDHKMIQQTCSLFGLDLERPPPVPPSRSYTVAGNTKLGYPQTRVMKMSFSDEGAVGSNGADGASNTLHKGETVVVIGASPRRGHLLVEHNTCTLHVPYQYLELKAAVGGTGQTQAAGVNI